MQAVTSERVALTTVVENIQLRSDEGGEPSTIIEHRINTAPDQVPISVPPYRFSNEKKKVIRAQVDNMIDVGIIEECNLPWVAPVVLINKSDGNVRVCVDYRRLNSVTRSDQYPIYVMTTCSTKRPEPRTCR